jgi:LysM repeat protein
VVLGETLEEIAKSYETTVEEIALANQLKGVFLEVNSTLLIPVSKEVFERFLEE